MMVEVDFMKVDKFYFVGFNFLFFIERWGEYIDIVF